MKSHFIERLIAGMMREEPIVLIKPAITPDVIPETLHLPETFYLHEKYEEQQRFVEPLSKPAVTSDSKEQVTLKKEKKAPVSEDSSKVTSPATQDIPPKHDVKAHYTETKSMKVEDPSKTSEEEDRQPTTSADMMMEKDIIRIIPKTKETIQGFRFEQTAETPVKKTIISTELFEDKEKGVHTIISTPLKSYKPLLTRERFGIVKHNEPEVIINIGRIDVRAATTTTPQKPSPRTSQFPPLSLKDYLKQRSEGKL